MAARVASVRIIGAGSSSSTPMLMCATTATPCTQCAEAVALGYASKNHRLNPSLLVQIQAPLTNVNTGDGGSDSSRLFNVVVDVGKTFRESALKVLVPLQVSRIDTVLLSHDHVDACWGVDDLRDFSRGQGPISVIGDERTLASMKRGFPYLFGSSNTFIADLAWEPLERDTVQIHGVEARRLRVEHGHQYFTNAFAFPTTQGHIVWMSDVSRVPDDAWATLESLQPIHALMLDMLSVRPYPTHFSVDEALEFAKRVNARRTYFVGMSHSLNYEELNHEIQNVRGHRTMKLGCDGEIVYSESPEDTASNL
jgi:phosphoribosyl 1,2-cyclic phosphodiesterase